MQQRGKLQEVLLLEQQGYVHFYEYGVSSCFQISVVCAVFEIVSLTCLIVGHLFCSCGWYRICLFTSIPWFDGSIQSVSILFLLILCCMLRLNPCYFDGVYGGVQLSIRVQSHFASKHFLIIPTILTHPTSSLSKPFSPGTIRKYTKLTLLQIPPDVWYDLWWSHRSR
jgi:hypothetical protein